MRPAPVFLAAALLASCRADSTAPHPPSATPPAALRSLRSSDDAEWFADRAEDAGLDFTHVNGMSGDFYFPEVMAPGAALLDYDNDGDLDVYLVQGQPLARRNPADRAAAPRDGPPLKGRMYRNDLHVTADGTRTLHFADATDTTGINADEYGMGVAVGDFNNDSWVDLHLTGLTRNRMLRNNGDGTFSDVSVATGTQDQGWSVSASFLDYDHDGWLDLYVGHYVSYSTATDRRCVNAAGEAQLLPAKGVPGSTGPALSKPG